MTTSTTTSPPPPAIVARGLRKSYRLIRGKQEVLRGVDLEIGAGEIVGLIGPNGAGKTTLMSCLLGFLRQDAGSIEFEGQANDDLSIRRRTGFVPERVGFERGVTGERFLLYMGRLSGLGGDHLRQRVDEILREFDLDGARRKVLAHYSRGMLQRIGMCQALLHDPDFLFLDEPTSGLDPNGMMVFRQVIERQRGRGSAVLLNSHQLTEIERMCDRILFLQNGTIAAAESLRGSGIGIVIRFLPTEHAASAALDSGMTVEGNSAFANVSSEEEIAKLVNELVERGVQLIEVRRRSAELERYFRSPS